MALNTGKVINNRYRIVSLLGQGGMGAVYRAWDLNLRMVVALKVNLDASPAAQKQFAHEATILARLSHPNLPRVIDSFFIPDEGQYLVMDFVEGEDLQQKLDKAAQSGYELGLPIPEAQILTWITQICEALEYLHDQSQPIIHRDLKPANIKIRPDGRAMLVDFGIAKVYSPTLATTVGAKAVTAGFSPPEQYGGGRTDRRSDIYSLGATLYTLLTGQILPESVYRMSGTVKAIPPCEINPQVSSHVERAILKAIEVEAAQRFQYAGEFRQALTQTAPPAEVQTVVATPATARMEELSGTVRVPPPAAPEARPAEAIPYLRPAKKRSSKRWITCLVALGIMAAVAWLGWRIIIPRIGSTGTSQERPSATPYQVILPTATPAQPQNQEQTQEPTRTSSYRPPTPTSPPPPEPPTQAPPPTEPPPPTSPPLGSPTLILDKGYNCRGGPDTSFELIWTFQTGVQLEIIGRSDNGWWLVRINDARTRRQQCWISGGQAEGDLSQVPYSSWTGTVDTAKTPWP